jgi:hypothetical protein
MKALCLLEKSQTNNQATPRHNLQNAINQLFMEAENLAQ